MQVANDVASLNELPSCEARPGRRVNNSASGKLQGGELREDCVEGALERGLAGGERGVRGVRGQQRRVGLGGLQMVHILPERLLALVRPAFDLVLRI